MLWLKLFAVLGIFSSVPAALLTNVKSEVVIDDEASPSKENKSHKSVTPPRTNPHKSISLKVVEKEGISDDLILKAKFDEDKHTNDTIEVKEMKKIGYETKTITQQTTKDHQDVDKHMEEIQKNLTSQLSRKTHNKKIRRAYKKLLDNSGINKSVKKSEQITPRKLNKWLQQMAESFYDYTRGINDERNVKLTKFCTFVSLNLQYKKSDEEDKKFYSLIKDIASRKRLITLLKKFIKEKEAIDKIDPSQQYANHAYDWMNKDNLTAFITHLENSTTLKEPEKVGCSINVQPHIETQYKYRTSWQQIRTIENLIQSMDIPADSNKTSDGVRSYRLSPSLVETLHQNRPIR